MTEALEGNPREDQRSLDKEEGRRASLLDGDASPAPADRGAPPLEAENRSSRSVSAPAAHIPPVSQQVARAPQRSTPEAGDYNVPPPDPSRFYEPSYLPRLKAMAARIIDTEGPLIFKRLSDRIGRAHGFERTGKQISSTVWTASKRLRRYGETPDGHKVFWPEGCTPQALVPFRGLRVAGERREWKEVPHPEKLWIIREMLQDDGGDTARAVAEAIGVGRVTTQFREEISSLARYLEDD